MSALQTCQSNPGPYRFNPLNTDLNPICHLLTLLEAHHILHVSRIRVNVTPTLQQSQIEIHFPFSENENTEVLSIAGSYFNIHSDNM